jgi:Fe-S cluster assembly protein SufD
MKSVESAAAEPAWLSQMRRHAASVYREQGLPTTKSEQWRHTSLAPLSEISLEPSSRRPAVLARDLAPYRIESGIELVFIDGHFAPAISRREPFPGVSVAPLSEGFGTTEKGLGSIAPAEDALVALNTSSFRDGARIALAAETILEAPIHLLFFSSGSDSDAVFPRVLIELSRASQAMVVETYAGGPGAARLSAAVTEARVGEGAVLEHVKLQLEAEEAFHIGLFHARQERDAVLRSHVFSFGARLARNEVHTTLAGTGAEAELNGLFFADGARHVDNHTVIDHAAPLGTSRELYKGVVAGRARGIFHGLIIVREGAQKTDAVQTNRNLLLSDQALVHSIPGLRILADDVKCRHGSTIGQLDEAAIFYLRSRGIGEEEARKLLARAFAGEVVDRLRNGALRRAVEARLAAIPELSA